MTPQRRAIVGFLGAAAHHPTVEEVFAAVNRRFPTTSRATVYNTLNLLRESGLLKELFKDGAIRFDSRLGPHHHFICRRCGRLEDIDSEAVQAFPLGELPGRQSVDTIEITLRGLCAACRGL
jgi:Fur family ferric uptake transcriptional regulator/Fur family peroxide stress response transcriptional regulator